MNLICEKITVSREAILRDLQTVGVGEFLGDPIEAFEVLSHVPSEVGEAFVSLETSLIAQDIEIETFDKLHTSIRQQMNRALTGRVVRSVLRRKT